MPIKEYVNRPNRTRRSGESGRKQMTPREGVSMRFIPTKFHAPLDYVVGVALIAATA
jgi:hypothetical protein